MKSHLIPEPNPIERDFRETDSARFYFLDQVFSARIQDEETEPGDRDDFPNILEMPMRNFLRVVFVH